MTRGARITAWLLPVALLMLPHPAAAIDAPKWVAAMFFGGKDSVGLRWTPVPGATAYKVMRSETAGANYKEISSGPQPQHFDQAVESGRTYYYVLQTVAGAETSANSSEKAVTVPAAGKKISPPEWRTIEATSTIENGQVKASVSLSWSKIPGAVAYNLYRSETQGSNYSLLISNDVDQYDDRQVEDGKTYYYVLHSFNGRFEESVSSAEKAVSIGKNRQLPRPADLLYVLRADPTRIAAFRLGQTRYPDEPWKESEVLGVGSGRLYECRPQLCAMVGNEIIQIDRDFVQIKRRKFTSLGAFVVDEGLLYVGAEHSLIILDGDLQELGRVPFGVEKDAHDILVHDGTAYVLDNMAQPIYLFRVDVRDPHAPRLAWSVLEQQVAHLPHQWLQPDLGLWVVQRNQWGELGSTNELLLLPIGEPATADKPKGSRTLQGEVIRAQTIFSKRRDGLERNQPIPPEYYFLIDVTPLPPHLAIIRTRLPNRRCSLARLTTTPEGVHCEELRELGRVEFDERWGRIKVADGFAYLMGNGYVGVYDIERRIIFSAFLVQSPVDLVPVNEDRQ